MQTYCIFSEKKNSINNFNYLTESDKKIINKMLPKKTIKDIVDFFKEKNALIVLNC